MKSKFDKLEIMEVGAKRIFFLQYWNHFFLKLLISLTFFLFFSLNISFEMKNSSFFTEEKTRLKYRVKKLEIQFFLII